MLVRVVGLRVQACAVKALSQSGPGGDNQSPAAHTVWETQAMQGFGCLAFFCCDEGSGNTRVGGLSVKTVPERPC